MNREIRHRKYVIWGAVALVFLCIVLIGSFVFYSFEPLLPDEYYSHEAHELPFLMQTIELKNCETKITDDTFEISCGPRRFVCQLSDVLASGHCRLNPAISASTPKRYSEISIMYNIYSGSYRTYTIDGTEVELEGPN